MIAQTGAFSPASFGNGPSWKFTAPCTAFSSTASGKRSRFATLRIQSQSGNRSASPLPGATTASPRDTAQSRTPPCRVTTARNPCPASSHICPHCCASD